MKPIYQQAIECLVATAVAVIDSKAKYRIDFGVDHDGDPLVTVYFLTQQNPEKLDPARYKQIMVDLGGIIAHGVREMAEFFGVNLRVTLRIEQYRRSRT